MSILKVANVHFESTGAARIDLTSANTIRIQADNIVANGSLTLGSTNVVTTLQSSFVVANAAFDKANAVATSANAYASSVGTSSNAYAATVGTSTNNYTSATYSTLTQFGSVFGVANAGFGLANTVSTTTSASFGVANAAFGLANSSSTRLTAAFDTTNAAFGSANTISSAVSSAFGVANGAFGKANTGLQNTSFTLGGSLTIAGATRTQGIIEKAYVAGTYIPPYTTDYAYINVLDQAVYYYNGSSQNNWYIWFRGNSSVSLDTAMTTGQSVSVAVIVLNSTAYYPTAHYIDGNAVTPKWQGGSAPSGGNASAHDIYLYNIIKTGAATFTVFASQTKFSS